MRIFPIDKTLNKIINETEEEFKDIGVSREDIKDIFYYFWHNCKKFIHSDKYPVINVPIWGRYMPKLPTLRGKYLKCQDPEEKEKFRIIVERLEIENKKRKRGKNGNRKNRIDDEQ